MEPPLSRSDDEELVRALNTGSREALAELYRRHHPALLRLLHQAGRSAARGDLGGQDVEDLAQKVWVTLLGLLARRSAEPFASADHFGNWLRLAARHGLADALRAVRRRQRLLPLAEVADDLQAGAVTDPGQVEPIEQLVSREQWRRYQEAFSACLAALEEPARTVVRLREQGSTLQEIATATGRSVTWVWLAWNRFLVRLRQRLRV
jgi:RNA polymerase sigma factor (sigma-70 family)